MDYKKEVIFCRKRFYDWVKEYDPSWHPKDVGKYKHLYDTYLTKLNPWEMIQEARVASKWKYSRIYLLVKSYKDLHNEDWPIPRFYG